MKSNMFKIVGVRGNVVTVAVDVRTVEFARLYLRIMWNRGEHA